MDKIKILSIEYIEEQVEVYDITVEDDHSFLVEGIFAHNCLQCGVMDGKVFYFDKNPPVGNERPPLHPYCRCCLIPITKSWKELGVDKEEIPEITRASWAGQVPASLKYSQWLRIQSDEFVKDILGPRRFNLWKSGALDFEKMATSNKILTLDELNDILKRQTLKTGGVGAKAKVKTWIKNPKYDVYQEQVKRLGYDTINVVSDTMGNSAKSKVVDEVGGYLTSLMNKYPKLEQKIAKFEHKITRKIKIVDDKYLNWKEKYTGAFYHNENGRLEIAYQISKKDGLKLGKDVYTNYDFNSVLRHEYGHFVEYYSGINEQVNWKNIYSSLNKKGFSFKDKITNYSATSVKEAFAESFSVYTSPLYKRGMLPKEIEKYFDDLLGKPKVGAKAKLTTKTPSIASHTEWTLSEKINAITMDEFVGAIKKRDWEKVSTTMDHVLSKHDLSAVQHNLNDVNIFRYMYEKGMSAKDARKLLDDYIPLSRSKLYKDGIPTKPLPSGAKARLTAKQIKKLEDEGNYIITKQDRSIAEHWEREIARRIGAEHSVGNRPFDYFLNNEFVEHKTVLRNTKGLAHQLEVEKDSLIRKAEFVKKYKVRPHQTAVDMDPSSDTFGIVFYRPKVGAWRLKNMEQLGHIDDPKTIELLKNKLMRGAKKFEEPVLAKSKPLATKSVKQAENAIQKKLGIQTVDYDGVDNDVAKLVNQYVQGVAEEYKIIPKAIRIDETFFTGKNTNLAGITFEDGTVAFNPRFFLKMDDLQSMVNEQYKIGQFLTGSRGHVIRHELGHQKYFQLGGTEATAGRKLSKETIAELKKGIGATDLPRFVSKYGLTNEGEFYAEAFSRLANGELLHPVVKKVILDIEKTIKKDLSKLVGKKKGIKFAK